MHFACVPPQSLATPWKDKPHRGQCKMSSSKAGVYLSEAPNPIPPPPLLHYIHIHTGKGGGRVEPERWGKGHQFTKLGRKYQP